MPKNRLSYYAFVFIVTLLAFTLRLRAVDMLPIDYDEDDYLAAAQRYHAAMRDGDIQTIIDYDYNFEHPPLTKMVYGAALLPLPPAPLLTETTPNLPPARSLPQPHFTIARLVSITWGTLEVLALALINPFAGLFLAIHTMQIKYTSQIMLEPLPAFTSLIMVWAYTLSNRRHIGWLGLSAVMLGLTAASKYTYCVAGIAILVDWLWATYPVKLRFSGLTRWLGPVLLWGSLAILIFIATNPRLWHDPIGRLEGSLLYHGDYAQSENVRRAGFPMWQPLVWLFSSVAWQYQVFLFPFDFFITILAAYGMRPLWQKQRVMALWFGIALGFLFLWPTKWPQYILILTAPLCLAAAEGYQLKIAQPLQAWWQSPSSYLPRLPSAAERCFTWQETRRALPWLWPGLIVLTLLTVLPLLFQLAIAMTDFSNISIRDGLNGGIGRAVWQGLTFQESPVKLEIFGTTHYKKTVQFTGFTLIGQLLSGALASSFVFDIMWTLSSVALQVILGVSAALLLHQPNLRFRAFWRTIFILPWAIPEFVGALLWLRIFEPRFGWLALASELPADIITPPWFANPTYTFGVFLVAATWYGFPFIMLATTASLKFIPVEVYEAAAIDGADVWAQFRWITWPLLQPLLMPAIIIRAIFAFNQFYLFYTLQAPPALLTFATISYYFFYPNSGFGGQFAVSAAVNLFTLMILIIMLYRFNRWSKAAEGVTHA